MAAAITKVSDITAEAVCEYIKEDYTALSDVQASLLLTMLESAKIYISSQTGIPFVTTDTTIKVMDDYQDFVIAVFVLVSDMWDNGSLYVDGKTINNTVDCILNEHRRNFL